MLNQIPMRCNLFILNILVSSFVILPVCAQEWIPVWQDEFNVEGSPGAQWGYETGYVRNRELQYYTSNPANVRVENGICILEARNEGGDSITSASIITLGNYHFCYGRIEVRAKIPTGKGTWPAIWLLGVNRSQVGWPACGEIDIMENVGFDPQYIHGNIHTKAYNHTIKTNKGNKIEVSAPWDDFHIYAIEWFDDRIDFFFDDTKYFTYENDKAANPDTWPFDKPHYLLINLSIGGTWGGQQGTDLSILPCRFEIDYVRHFLTAAQLRELKP